MADDFDDSKEALREAFKKEYQDLKSAISNVNTRTQLITVLANTSSLFSKASELGIDLKMSELLESAEAKVKSYESEVTQNRDRQEIEEAAEQKLLEEALAEAQKVANEAREEDLEKHFEEYKKFQKDLREQFKEEHDLLDQAIKDPNSLTAEQRVQLTGQYATDKERKAAKKKEQEMSKRLGVHYAIKNKAKESIAYRQGKIKENEAVINHPDTPEPVREQRRQENVVHEQKIVKNEQKLVAINPVEQDIEKQRKQILALVNSDTPELAVELLRRHYLDNEKDYNQERQKNLNHQGYNELQSMVMALGGHKKLGLPKPEHPISEQQTLSAQNINSPSAIESQVKAAEKPATQTLQEHVESIQKSLERKQLLSKDTVGSSNSVPNKNQAQDPPNPPAKKSRFAQNLKKMEGRG